MIDPVAKRIHNCYAGLAALPTDALHELMGSPDMKDVSHDLTRCVILMELLYRLDGTHHDEVPGLVWILTFGSSAGFPVGLKSPSEAFPWVPRRWEQH